MAERFFGSPSFPDDRGTRSGNSCMGKITLGPLIRHLITLLIGFFVARQMLSRDVAEKLYAGETAELWSGGWSISIKQVVDFILNAIIPALIPILISMRGRLREKYKLIVARLSPEKLTNEEVKAKVDQTPITKMIATVAAKP